MKDFRNHDAAKVAVARRAPGAGTSVSTEKGATKEGKTSSNATPSNNSKINEPIAQRATVTSEHCTLPTAGPKIPPRQPHLLIAGIGNIFFGDDAFGSEVARELKRRPLPDCVLVEDFGIRSYDLAYALMEGREAILIDAVPRGHEPGTLYLIEPDLDSFDDDNITPPDGHSMNPVSVLRMVKSLGGEPGKITIVGCEPSVLDSDELGLSEPVQAAVPRAIAMVESLVEKLLHSDVKTQPIPHLTGSRRR